MSQVRLKGYVHNVSPSRRNTNQSFSYFNFSLQVSQTTTRNAICYDPGKKKLLKRFQESRQPATLINITQKRNPQQPLEENIIVTRRSRIVAANDNDIPYEYDDNSAPEYQEPLTTLQNIAYLAQNQIVSVKGVLTLSAEDVEEVTISSGATIPKLNHCVITDHTATVRLTLWGNTIQNVTNHNSYFVSTVRVKQFDRTNYLTTTPKTTFIKTEEDFPLPKQELFDSFFQPTTIFVKQIHLVDTFKTSLRCNNCTKTLSHLKSTNTSTAIIKCPNCSVTQRLASCSSDTSVRIAVKQDEDNHVLWLTAFNSVLQKMLNHPSDDVSINSSEEDVYSQLFKLQNFELQYSDTSFVIKNITF